MGNTNPGLVGRKLGMTQIWGEADAIVPVTVIEAGPNTVLAVKSSDGKDGYSAIQVAFGSRKAKHVTQPEAKAFEKILGEGAAIPAHVRELRLPEAEAGKYQPKQDVKVGDVFKVGDIVDVVGTSKGRGFQGVVRRHNMPGMRASHGAHEYFRHVGAVGTRLTPGMILSGKRMPGHMGAHRVTIQNLSVAKIDADRNLLFIHGGVPGPDGALVVVRKTSKRHKPKIAPPPSKKAKK